MTTRRAARRPKAKTRTAGQVTGLPPLPQMRAMARAIAERNVARGVRLLDRKKPDWFYAVIKQAAGKGIDIESTETCILGSIFRDEAAHQNASSPYGYGHGMLAVDDDRPSRDHGFNGVTLPWDVERLRDRISDQGGDDDDERDRRYHALVDRVKEVQRFADSCLEEAWLRAARERIHKLVMTGTHFTGKLEVC